MSRRRYIEAENVFWQALMTKPDYIPALIDMGRLSATKGDAVTAERYFSRVLALDPFNASGHYNLAMVYRMEGRTVEAENEMNKFREIEAGTRRKESTDR
jgi:tetratricopeptide (TPR) repeat protein